MRKVVHEVSGQYYVPVLKDGDIVLTETDDILDHLESRRTVRNGSPAADSGRPADPRPQ